MERLIRTLADFVVTKRALAISLVVLTTAGLASQVPKMRSDPAPEKLIGSFEGFDAAIGEDFRARFGDTSRVLILLVEGADVFSPELLEYQRRLAQRFGQSLEVEKVDSLTTATIP